jgi:hypothetical protein
VFKGRERELSELNKLYGEDKFQLFILYGRRRVGKTALLNEFCKDKESIFYSAEQSIDKVNLEKFSAIVFEHFGEEKLESFSSWGNALLYIHEKFRDKPIIVVFDEFPYLAGSNKGLMSEMQNLIDHTLVNGKMFLVLCGSYMSFMEDEVLGGKSPLFGRRTAQCNLKTFDYKESELFLDGFSEKEKLMFYGALGGTPLYLNQVNHTKNFEENMKDIFFRTTSYMYEEPTLLLRQEIQEPGVYSAIIEAIACGASRANEISTKINEPSAKCLKYIATLINLGIIYKEFPYGEKDTSRKTLYRISDFMFRFWYRYVFSNRTLIETGAVDAVWQLRVKPDYDNYMGLVFEQICKEYLLRKNAQGKLPILFRNIGRWWGTDPVSKTQIEIDLIAGDGESYLFGECKWRNEPTDISVYAKLKENADIFHKNRQGSWYIIFSRSGFSEQLSELARKDENLLLVELNEL